jgi:murein DD-endopeptidase MepM/ murein hydrolase activator NlpD
MSLHSTALKAANLLTLPLFIFCSSTPSTESVTLKPIRTVIDLNLGEEKKIELSDGSPANIELLDVSCLRDKFLQAVRSSTVRVRVNGETVTLNSGNYNLPVKVSGVRIDCPVTRHYYSKTMQDSWGLDKDARLRLWPAEGPLIHADAFAYPARQLWFATDTQMSNEPVYVNGCENPEAGEIYYHSGLDIGGCEDLVDIVSASAGTVIQCGDSVLSGYEDYPLEPRYESVFVLGTYGWLYRYSHLKSIEAGLRPGTKVKKGQRIGGLGKEGNSGGWAHLHFEIKAIQPSGRWGTEEGYAYFWESYLKTYKPALIAVARPHVLTGTGEVVTLNGSKSRSLAGEIESYEWIYTQGGRANGAVQQCTYDTPGQYSEVLKVIDSRGNVDYDVCPVIVIDRNNPRQPLPAIHAAYYPTFGITPGEAVTFRVRSFSFDSGNETLDFGDGSPAVSVQSRVGYLWNHSKYIERGIDFKANALDPQGYAETVHSFAKAGDYLVRVERTGDNGRRAVTHLHVHVAAGE